MNPTLIALIIEYSLKHGIPAAREIVKLIHTPAPTLADWNAAFDAAESDAKKFLAETANLAK